MNRRQIDLRRLVWIKMDNFIKSIYRSDRAYTYVYGGIRNRGPGLAKPEKGGATVPRYFFNVVDGVSKNLMGDSDGIVLSDLSGARKRLSAGLGISHVTIFANQSSLGRSLLPTRMPMLS
jgi:hypothetical protein